MTSGTLKHSGILEHLVFGSAVIVDARIHVYINNSDCATCLYLYNCAQFISIFGHGCNDFVYIFA